MPAVAAVVLVAVLTAAGAAFTMSRDEPIAAPSAGGVSTDSQSLPDSVRMPVATVPSRPDTSPPAPDDTELLRKPAGTAADVGTSGRRRDGAAREREIGPAAIKARLRAARRAVEANMQASTVDAAELRRTIAVLARTLPEITTFADSVDARYLRAQALGLIGETDRSCRELEQLSLLELERQLQTEIGALRASACQ